MSEIDPVDVMEFWNDRASMAEYEAGYARIIAESLALKEVIKRYRQEAGRMVQRHRKEGSK